MEKQTIPVIGMACSSCAANVERKLQSLNGVTAASVSLATRTAVVEYDPAVITLTQMKAAVGDIGFDLVVDQTESVEVIERRHYSALLKTCLLSWGFAALVMAFSMGWLSAGSEQANRQLAMVVALANIVVCGRQFYRRAWQQMCHFSASMDTLVVLSTSVSFLWSAYVTLSSSFSPSGSISSGAVFFDSSVMIITFVLTGKLLEERARHATAASIRTLMGLQPKTARLVTMTSGDNVPESVPLTTVTVGDILEVHAGEKMPVDGTVTWAESFMTSDGAYVDESMISGEPTPVLKQAGSQVLAGTILQQGKLRFRATQIGEQTALAAIIRTVSQAQGSKAPVQRIVDRLARWFVPVVACLSLLTFLLWWLFGGPDSIHRAVLSAVAVLVVACPCAMGLATPTALMVGIGKAAERNILIKDATALEHMRRVNAVVIDKTGTLTIPNVSVDFTRASSLPLEEREQLKPHAAEAVALLHDRGVEVHMMSGDREEAAAYWAAKAGISHWQSNVQPGDKEALVRRLQADGRCVAMVGDGINDSQALAAADVSIAMGTGTDVAMDVSQVTLMGTDLRRIAEALQLSTRTVGMIRQNLFWAFVYNLVCIPLAAGLPRLFGLDMQLTPTWASALMAMSSISVVLNSLRLRYLH